MCSPRHSSASKTGTPKPPQTAPPTGNQIFRHLSLQAPSHPKHHKIHRTSLWVQSRHNTKHMASSEELLLRGEKLAGYSHSLLQSHTPVNCSHTVCKSQTRPTPTPPQTCGPSSEQTKAGCGARPGFRNPIKIMALVLSPSISFE